MINVVPYIRKMIALCLEGFLTRKLITHWFSLKDRSRWIQREDENVLFLRVNLSQRIFPSPFYQFRGQEA